MFGFGKKRGPTIGLDINSDRLTLFRLEKGKVALELTHFASQPTPPNSVREGLLADPEGVGSIVAELLSESGISQSPPPLVNISVPGQSVVIRLLPVPTGMPPEELADVVVQEAINHVPFPVNEANLDWAIMEPTERTDVDGVRRVDVVLAAIQKAICDSYWRMAEVAGLKLGRLDVSSLSAIRALSAAGYLQTDEHYSMSVHIRHDATDINIIRAGMPLFSRSVLLGLDTLGEAISRSLDCHLDEALKMLPQIQLMGMAVVEPRLGQAAQIARTVFGDITDEVHRSLEFYRSQVGEVLIGQVLLCGAGCAIPQLEQFMANRLNISTTLIDPLRNISYDPARIPEIERASYVMTLGALLDPASLPVPTVNLDLNKEGPSVGVLEGIEARPTVRIIPEEAPWFMPVLSAGVVVSVILAGLWAYFSQYEVPKKQAELSKITQEVESDKKQLSGLSQVNAERDLLLKKKRLLDGIVKWGTPWAQVLQTVRENTPSGIQVLRIYLEGSKIEIEGTGVDFSRIASLSVNLNETPLLKNATVDSAFRFKDNPRIISFKVLAELRPEGARPGAQVKSPLLSGESLKDWQLTRRIAAR